jgi:hypothetical protein
VYKLAEYKAILVSVAISLAAFAVFLLMIGYFNYRGNSAKIEDEHRIIQALRADEKTLLYSKSIQVPELTLGSGMELSQAFGEEFATEECLALASAESIELSTDLLQPGNIVVFDDDWYREVSGVNNFQQTLYAEGYFGTGRISRPCYNTGRDKAIIYYEQDCGPGCGNGEVILLTLGDGTWQPLTRRIVWVE